MSRLPGLCSWLLIGSWLGFSTALWAADPQIVFEKQPAPLPGNPPPAGAVEFQLKWTNCLYAQKLEVNWYKVLPGHPPPPPAFIGGVVIHPIPGGANGELTYQVGGLPSGQQVLVKAKVINNADPPKVIAEETSKTVTVP